MSKAFMTILGIIALIMVPAMTLAKDNGQKEAAGPTPNPSAYEHADENAKFLRDSHDMGKHEGQELQDDKGKTKDKPKSDDQSGAKGKEKSKDKAKGKGKGKENAGKEKDKPAVGKELDKAEGKDKDKGAQTDADKLLEQVRKPKEEKGK